MRRGALEFALGAGILALFGVGFWLGSDTRPARGLDALSQYTAARTAQNEHLLRIHQDLAWSFDVLNEDLEQVRTGQARLNAIARALDLPELADETPREAQVHAYMREQSVLRNSRRYLPTLLSEVQPAIEPELVDLVQQIAIRPQVEESEHAALVAQLQQFEAVAFEAGAALTTDRANLIRHASVLLTRTPRANAALEALLETDARPSDLRQALHDRDAANRQLRLISLLALALTALFLLLRAASFGSRWIRAQQSLERANIQLQTALAQREEARAKAVLARDEAQQFNRAKSSFLANMSHELRTPLNAILGYSELLAETSHDPETQEDLSRIRGAGQHLLQLINDVLDLSKIEAGKMDVRSEPVALAPVLHEVTSAARVLAAPRGNTLVVEGDSDAWVRGDPVRLRQILLNLLGNAAKFTKNGTLTVRVVGEGSRVRIDVADTGIGIPAEKHDTLFRPFEQVDGSATRRHDGSGLGLAIVKRLVDAMDGQIAVESVPGVGSTFRVWLAAEEPVSHTPEAGYVLVVEDDPAVQHFITGTLDSWRIEIAGSGEEALERMKSKRPSLVLLDIRLPGISGWTVLEVMRHDPSLADVPVIVSTATDTPERDDVEHLLRKPLDRSSLTRVVSQFVEQEH